MATNLSAAAENAAVNAVTALLNVGGAGSIKIYDGTEPAAADTALSGNNLLATLPLSATAFAAASAGAAAMTGSPSAAAALSGTATFARFCNNVGTCVFQVTVGVSGAQLNLNSVAISSGATVTVTSFTYTQPA